ncbi:hypothetical protein OHR68_19885 [Spirillospora sp. NBC_00431]
MKAITRPGKDPIPRENWTSVMVAVRSFYLDIAEWALEDPSWAPWAVPSPVRRSDTGGFTKVKKKAQAKMHQRIRERLPRLPGLVDTAEQHHAQQKRMLAATEATPIGEVFEHDGHRYQRLSRQQVRIKKLQHYRPTIVVAQDPTTGEHLDISRSEDEAFWSWAITETLRHTGVFSGGRSSQSGSCPVPVQVMRELRSCLWATHVVHVLSRGPWLQRLPRSFSVPSRPASRAVWASQVLTCPCRLPGSARSRPGSASKCAP